MSKKREELIEALKTSTEVGPVEHAFESVLSVQLSQESVLDCIRIMRTGVDRNSVLKKAIQQLNNQKECWNRVILRIFRLFPYLFTYLNDGVTYLNELLGIDFSGALAAAQAQQTALESTFYEAVDGTGSAVRTDLTRIPKIVLTHVEGYSADDMDKDLITIAPQLEKLIELAQKPLLVGPVVLGYSPEFFFNALFIFGFDETQPLHINDLRLHTAGTKLPVLLIPGKFEPGSANVEKAFARMNLKDNPERANDIGRTKLGSMEDLREEVDVGRSISRSDVEGKGTIGLLVRIGESLFPVTANHVLSDGGEWKPPAPANSNVQFPANMDVYVMIKQLRFSRGGLSSSEKKDQAQDLIDTLDTHHGQLFFGGLGRDSYCWREDWAIVKCNQDRRILSGQAWSEEASALFRLALIHEDLPDNLQVRTAGRRLAVTGENVVKIGSQGGPIFGKMGSYDYRMFYKKSWLDLDVPEASIPDNVESCRFASVSSAVPGRGLAESGDSGGGTYGARVGHTLRDGVVDFLGQLVAVYNGSVGSIGLMVPEHALFRQMEAVVGGPVDLVR